MELTRWEYLYIRAYIAQQKLADFKGQKNILVGVENGESIKLLTEQWEQAAEKLSKYIINRGQINVRSSILGGIMIQFDFPSAEAVEHVLKLNTWEEEFDK